MAFFKWRWPGQQEQAEKTSKRSRAAQTESIEIMRRRARHRLMGAAILVVIGVVFFPMLFDTQPRPILVNIPINIPDRQAVPELAVAPTAAVSRDSSSSLSGDVGNGLVEGEQALPSTPASAPNHDRVQTRNAAVESPQPLSTGTAAQPATASPPKPAAPTPAIPASTPTPTEPKVQRSAASTASTTASTAVDERFIVQIGAFAENAKARDVRLKLEKAGIKTYTQVVETKDGKRIRVRVGPLASRAEAEKTANRIKSLDLPAAILTL